MPGGFTTVPVDSLAPGGAPADSGAEPAVEYRVGVIRVRGNAWTDSARIVRTFDIPPGARFAEDAVRRGIRKLFALGLFSDVSVDRDYRGDRVDLVIQVKERPRLAKIEIAGNKKKKTEDLQKKLTVRVGEVFSPALVASNVDSLVRFYDGEGYAQVKVTTATDTLPAGGLKLRFLVDEGEKVKITRIEFRGVTAFPAKTALKKLKTRRKGLFGGGDVKEENFTEDKEKLEAFYHSKGYRDMRVTGHELKPGDEPRKLTLVLDVEEGIRYRLGNVSWVGNTVVPTAELAPLGKFVPGQVYDASQIEKAQGDAYAAFAERGYLYVGIEPRESVRDSNVVDLAYQVAEGKPSNVRYVNITGNHNTREKVIRREVSIREGDRFRRSALMRTQGDLSRLGLFEEVVPDFTPAESTDVDINIKVKEKQVGTASAGAGYTGDAGLTGFIELGHNNVLGNGQSLSLHLERGSRRSDYYASFTEPWFHDSPTLLGFSVFNTSTVRDLYEDQRRGGSGKIGRPLPWPDYSRGSIGYQLEDVTIDSLTTLSSADRVALQGLTLNKPARTSSVELDFSRNSTDNAFYPTKGTRLTVSSELAGGPFLGSVAYTKTRTEGRLYLPSILKGVTSMVRARFGVLGIWAGQHDAVPSYERFRLGGGSTLDPLRGYDDYQVVPEKNIQRVGYGYYWKHVTATDSVYVPTGYDTVRYPGGRYMTLLTFEQQFPIVHPLHAVLFFDAGNTWDEWRDIQPGRLKMGAGIGFRMEIPMLGNIGFDYGYGFNRDDGPRPRGHFLLGNVNF